MAVFAIHLPKKKLPNAYQKRAVHEISHIPCSRAGRLPVTQKRTNVTLKSSSLKRGEGGINERQRNRAATNIDKKWMEPLTEDCASKDHSRRSEIKMRLPRRENGGSEVL